MIFSKWRHNFAFAVSYEETARPGEAIQYFFILFIFFFKKESPKFLHMAMTRHHW